MPHRSGVAARLRRLVEAADDDAGRAAGKLVGPAIRARRRRLGLTLQELADHAHLSAAFISQLERGLTSPSITSLASLATALGVKLSYFVRVPGKGQVLRRAAAPETIDIGSPVQYCRLSGDHAERKMEALLIEVPAGLRAPTTRREGEGFWYILHGELELTIGAESFRLGAGDSAHFDQRHPYTMSNVGDDAVRMLWVGTPALL